MARITLPGVDLMAAGTWNLSIGQQTFSRADMANAIEAAKCPAVGPLRSRSATLTPVLTGSLRSAM